MRKTKLKAKNFSSKYLNFPSFLINHGSRQQSTSARQKSNKNPARRRNELSHPSFSYSLFISLFLTISLSLTHLTNPKRPCALTAARHSIFFFSFFFFYFHHPDVRITKQVRWTCNVQNFPCSGLFVAFVGDFSIYKFHLMWLE